MNKIVSKDGLILHSSLFTAHPTSLLILLLRKLERNIFNVFNILHFETWCAVVKLSFGDDS